LLKVVPTTIGGRNISDRSFVVVVLDLECAQAQGAERAGAVHSGSVKNNGQRLRLYRMIEFIGRWSMVDVFVDTFTAALIQLQPLMSVEPGPGLFFFAAVVVLTMLAVESFDPRLIWDATSSQEVRHGG
jgi:uncharacterized paraquat-inducible protein A